MAEFRFEAIAPDGAEVRDSIEAVDHKTAEEVLREKGLFVYRMRSVGSSVQRRCAECNHVNNWNVMVCASCGAPVRGPDVGANEHVELTELPEGLVVRENIDGSITVTKTGWRRWEWAWIWLVAVGWIAVGWTLVHFYAPHDVAHHFAGTAVLERMPTAKAAEVVAEVKKEFGHNVGLNQVYMARSKAAASSSTAAPAKKRRRRRRRMAAAGPAASNGRAAASPAGKWVEAIKLARQLLKTTGGSESAVAIIKAVEG